MDELSILIRMFDGPLVLFGNTTRDPNLFLRPVGTENLGVSYNQPVPVHEFAKLLSEAWIEPIDPLAASDQVRWFRISALGTERIRALSDLG